MEERLISLAEQLGLKNLLENFPCQISVGQKQQGATARAIITNLDDLLLADGPAGALDSMTSGQV